MTPPLTSPEREILNRLLSAEFPGCDELRNQAHHANTERIDDNGSVRFTFAADVIKAPVARRIPVEADSIDADGVSIHALLHVVGGELNELEIYKDDSSRVKSWPNLDSWNVSTME